MGGDSSSLISLDSSGKWPSFMWKTIINPLTLSGSFSSLLCVGIGFMVGNSAKIHFWEDEWIDEVILHVAFPQNLALATNKSGKIIEYGAWVIKLGVGMSSLDEIHLIGRLRCGRVLWNVLTTYSLMRKWRIN